MTVRARKWAREAIRIRETALSAFGESVLDLLEPDVPDAPNL